MDDRRVRLGPAAAQQKGVEAFGGAVDRDRPHRSAPGGTPAPVRYVEGTLSLTPAFPAFKGFAGYAFLDPQRATE